ncbi:hypothetical protein BDQ17DRAFT_1363900 [Cyathus striatus]|nr:hypothetical protein BDQ17DRAFT_1363900 [Cyathus striatus]
MSLRSAPLLSHFDIYGLKHPKQLFINFPWSQITHFKSRSNEYSGEELDDVLQMMPNLVSFTLDGEIFMTTCISLLKLQTFTLGFSVWIHATDSTDATDTTDTTSATDTTDATNATNALDVFTTPFLKTLHLYAKFEPQTILQFFGSVAGSIEELTISYTPMGEGWKTEEIQGLRKLCLHRPDCINQDLQWLTRDNQYYSSFRTFNNCLPELEILEIKHIRPEVQNVVEYLIAMLKSRLLPVEEPASNTHLSERSHCLKSATITFERMLNRIEESALRGFIRSNVVRKSGLQMTITHGRHRNTPEITRISNQYSKCIVQDGREQFE